MLNDSLREVLNLLLFISYGSINPPNVIVVYLLRYAHQRYYVGYMTLRIKTSNTNQVFKGVIIN